MTEQKDAGDGLVTVRVCVASGLRVRLIPGDRCLAHGTAVHMCRTALREVPADEADRLWRKGRPAPPRNDC